MPNAGAFPLDSSTNVGKVRLIIGDTISVPFDPVQAGVQDYTLFSDDEINAFLDNGGDSPIRASGWAYISLAGVAAQNAVSIKDFDLSVDERQKAEALRLQAAWYFAEADRLDGEGAEAFQIVSTGRRRTRVELAEADLSEFDYTDYIV
jgi:hypothetical protein